MFGVLRRAAADDCRHGMKVHYALGQKAARILEFGGLLWQGGSQPLAAQANKNLGSTPACQAIAENLDVARVVSRFMSANCTLRAMSSDESDDASCL